jgi:hypothetical protein
MNPVLNTPQPTIKINHIIMPAVSIFNILSEMCAICRENVTDKCLKCSNSSDNNTCYGVIGVCSHAYHNCCVSQYTTGHSSTQKCPTCNKKWEMKKRNSNKSNKTNDNLKVNKSPQIHHSSNVEISNNETDETENDETEFDETIDEVAEVAEISENNENNLTPVSSDDDDDDDDVTGIDID